MALRILVAGGRRYTDKVRVYQELDRIDELYKVDTVIQGGATGADLLAWHWAKDRNKDVFTYPAYWANFGTAAGPIRNEQMIKEAKADMIVLFPGGNGTADIKKRAIKAKMQLIEIFDENVKNETLRGTLSNMSDL